MKKAVEYYTSGLGFVALFEEFQAKGVVLHRIPEDAVYGLRNFVIDDPESHRLSFGTPLA